MRVGGTEFGDFVPGEHEVKAAVKNLATCVPKELRDRCHFNLYRLGVANYLDAEGWNRLQGNRQAQVSDSAK